MTNEEPNLASKNSGSCIWIYILLAIVLVYIFATWEHGFFNSGTRHDCMTGALWIEEGLSENDGDKKMTDPETENKKGNTEKKEVEAKSVKPAPKEKTNTREEKPIETQAPDQKSTIDKKKPPAAKDKKEIETGLTSKPAKMSKPNVKKEVTQNEKQKAEAAVQLKKLQKSSMRVNSIS